MSYRLPLCFSVFALLACSPKVDLTESASDTFGSETLGTTDPGGGSASIGHSQTSAPSSDTDSTSPGQTVTTANPSLPGTVSETTASTETEGSVSDTVPGTVSTVTTGIETTDGPDSFSTGFTTGFTTGGACNDQADQPQNAPCTDQSGCGCASDSCFVIPALGGFCGECLTDADCPAGGCTVPNPIVGLGAVCNLGQAGDGCQTDAVCSDPSAPACSEVFEIPGIITVATCGACQTDADCPPQASHCTPDYDLLGFTGQFVCKPTGSVPNNTGCNVEGTGDQACASGFCGEANIMGLLKLGICGECIDDSDCAPGEQCTEPVADLDNGALIGSVCV